MDSTLTESQCLEGARDGLSNERLCLLSGSPASGVSFILVSSLPTQPSYVLISAAVNKLSSLLQGLPWPGLQGTHFDTFVQEAVSEVSR